MSTNFQYHDEVPTPEEIVLFTPWRDPIVDERGWAMCSEYTEVYWLPVIGPTALLAGRKIVRMLGDRDYVDADLYTMASTMGLSYTARERSPFGRALHRLVMFGLAMPTADGWAVRTMVPNVPHRFMRRLPDVLVAAHNVDLEERAAA